MNRARVLAGATRPATTTRAKLERALASIDERDAGLPRSATLVIRRLEVRSAPDLQEIESSDVDLCAIAAGASRPARAPAPASASAVVFHDDAEILIAFARDLLGSDRLPWWWRATLRTWVPSWSPTDRASVTAAVWHGLAHALPAAVRLDPATMSAAAVALAPSDAASILADMATAHGMPMLAASSRRVRAGGAVGTAPPPTSVPAGAPATTSDAPWTAWSRSNPDLDGVAAALVGTAHGIGLRIESVRRREYADACERWQRDHAEPARRPATAVAPRLRPLGATPSRDRAVPPSEATPPTGVAVDPAARASESGATPGTRAGAADQGSRSPIEETRFAGAEDHRPIEPTVDRPEGDAVPTGLGGAFYLLAVLALLDLPATAVGPDQPGDQLSRWAVLELVCRAMVADLEPALQTDGLWAVLAELDGRQASAPIAFRGSRAEFRVASAWQAILGADPDVRPVAVSGPISVPGPLVPWARNVTAVVELLLARGGLDRTVILAPGALTVGLMHVVVDLPHTATDLAVRRLGLDRDPGWVPELGYVVELRFS